MRKKIIKFLALGALALTCSGVKANAATTKVDGVTWVYTVADGKATNVYTQGASGNLVIPERLNGYQVTSIGGGTETTSVATNITSVTLPSGAIEINDYAFKDSNLRSIVIGTNDKITKIGQSAFEDCVSLEDVCIGDIEEIGDESFRNCNSLTKLNLSSFGGNIGNSAFEDCTSLEELYVGDIKTFGDYAFKGCTDLKRLEINCSSLKNQFQDCYSLENIVIGVNVQNISPESFLVKNAGAAKANLKPGTNVRADDYYLSKALMEKKSFDFQLPQGAERNWYFKNPKTKIAQSDVKTSGYADYQTIEPNYNPVYGWISKSVYSSSSIFFPGTQANIFSYRVNSGMNYNYFLNYHISVNTSTYQNKPEDAFAGEYFNTQTGYAINNIYVKNFNGSESIESAVEGKGSIYENIALKAINIINMQENDEVPSYVPEPIATGINATYDGTVVEGTALDLNNIHITINYNNGTTKDFPFDSATMSINSKEIVIGDNNFDLNAFDTTCSFSVTGTQKQITKINAGYEGTVVEGTALDLNSIQVTVYYNNGTSETLPFDGTTMSLNSEIVNIGENTFELTACDMSCSLSVTGTQKQATQIAATYEGTVVEGTALDLNSIQVTVYYNNGTSETVPFDSTTMSLNSEIVNIGENTFELLAYDMSCSFSVTGTKKQAIEIKATYNGTVVEGTALDLNYILVDIYYNDGTCEKVPFNQDTMSLDYKAITIGQNKIDLKTLGITYTFSVTGVTKQISGIKAEYNGTVVEGTALDLNKIKVTFDYDNGTFEEVPFDKTTMYLDSKIIAFGPNNFDLKAYDNYTCCLSVMGTRNTSTSSDYGTSTDTVTVKSDSDTVETGKVEPTNTKKPSTTQKKDNTTTKKPSTTQKKDNTNIKKPSTNKKKANTTTKKPSTNKKKANTTTKKPSTNKKKVNTTTKKPSTNKKKVNTTIKKSSTNTKTNITPLNVSSNNGNTPIMTVYDIPNTDTTNESNRKENKVSKQHKEKDSSEDMDEATEPDLLKDHDSEPSVEYENVQNEEYAYAAKLSDNNKSHSSKKKSSSNPAVIIIIVVIAIAIVGLILTKKKHSDEDQDDENEPESHTSYDENEFVDEEEE